MLQKHLLLLYFATCGSLCETREQHGCRKVENDKDLTAFLESLAQLLLILFKQFVFNACEEVCICLGFCCAEIALFWSAVKCCITIAKSGGASCPLATGKKPKQNKKNQKPNKTH